MKRLTERLTDKSYCISDIRAIQKETFYEDMECRRGFDLYTGKAINKLAEYEDLEEQGKLLKLPCAVGDTVYLVSFRKKCYKMGNTYLVNDDLECAFCENECVCKAKKEYFIEEIKATLPIIGNMIERPDGFMVFLTRQEAEAKLAEMEGKK